MVFILYCICQMSVLKGPVVQQLVRDFSPPWSLLGQPAVCDIAATLHAMAFEQNWRCEKLCGKLYL